MDADALKATIRSAWAGAEAPIPESVAPGEPWSEAGRITAFFGGRRWEDVDLGALRDQYRGDGSACLYFMSAEAFRYYLPSYMVIALEDYDDADVVGQAAVNALTPTTNPSLAGDEAVRYDGFTRPQRRAIVAFLELMQHRHGDDFLLGELERALAFWRTT